MQSLRMRARAIHARPVIRTAPSPAYRERRRARERGEYVRVHAASVRFKAVTGADLDLGGGTYPVGEVTDWSAA